VTKNSLPPNRRRGKGLGPGRLQDRGGGNNKVTCYATENRKVPAVRSGPETTGSKTGQKIKSGFGGGRGPADGGADNTQKVVTAVARRGNDHYRKRRGDRVRKSAQGGCHINFDSGGKCGDPKMKATWPCNSKRGGGLPWGVLFFGVLFGLGT